MKKFYVCCTACAMALFLCLTPSLKMVKAAKLSEAPAMDEAVVSEAPEEEPEDAKLSLVYVTLEEQEKEILDEVLCDYVSEEVVRLMDAGIDYEIDGWFDREACTYLFFEKRLPQGTVYTACGYALTENGSYAYFELSSPNVLTEEMVEREVSQ